MRDPKDMLREEKVMKKILVNSGRVQHLLCWIGEKKFNAGKTWGGGS